MDDHKPPLVSIGVPVFNGERELDRCLDGLLRQDYPNLEIIISDNASTDGTQAICERYAQADRRIQYVRADRNNGSYWNFNKVFELSSGTYFMWAAHDDAREPTFVSLCVSQLEHNLDAVLCQSHTAVWIEGHDKAAYVARLDTIEKATDAAARYREALTRLPATAVYGLYRATAMRKTRMWQRIATADQVFIQELSIHGRFVQAPEILFNYWGRKSWNTIHQDLRHYLGFERKPWWYLPFLVLFANQAKRVSEAAIPFSLKLRLWAVLACHQVRHVVLRAVLKVTGALCPERHKVSLGAALYRRWMHNPNITVLDQDLFFERVCKPQLGWWR